MATHAVRSAEQLSGQSGSDDLTDEHINQLLARITTRRLEKPDREDAVVNVTRTSKWTLPKLDAGTPNQPYVSTKAGVTAIDSASLLDHWSRRQNQGFRKVEDPVVTKNVALEKKKATAGPGWFNLPRTDLTPELKRDLQMLKMRNVLDSHRHYKKEGGTMKAPEFSQVGTIIQGPTEFFTGRIENKKRKRTFVEEVLAGEQETGRFRKKYGELQGRKTSGKKAFYQALKDKRRSGVKKGGP